MKNKLFSSVLTCVFVLLFAQSAAAAGGIIQSSADAGGMQLGYLLYIPEETEQPQPLVVYLHGGSGKGSDPAALIENDGFPQYVAQGKMGNISAYVLMPQLPASARGWEEADAAVTELIELMCRSYNIDASRISLTGHSMGGSGTWVLAARHPELFSCVAPLSGSVQCTPENADALSTLPIWSFVGTADSVVRPNSSMEMTSMLKARKSEAKLTAFEGASHFDVPALAYLDERLDLLGWLTSQSRSK